MNPRANQPSDEDLYRLVLTALGRDKLRIRTESTVVFPGLTARYERPDIIRLARPTGGLWALPGNVEAQEALLAGATHVFDELSLLAHERGHHLSTFDDYEEIRSRLDIDIGTVSDDDKHAVFEEEEFAWREAEKLLRSLGVTDLGRFEIVKARHLGTYLDMWPNRQRPAKRFSEGNHSLARSRLTRKH